MLPDTKKMFTFILYNIYFLSTGYWTFSLLCVFVMHSDFQALL
jgi:hypothetical protein